MDSIKDLIWVGEGTFTSFLHFLSLNHFSVQDQKMGGAGGGGGGGGGVGAGGGGGGGGGGVGGGGGGVGCVCLVKG